MSNVAPLQGYRVLDLAAGFSLYCTKLLADLGADVIRIEPPGGAAVRRAEPFAGDEAGDERSLQHLYFNTSKRAITLDLEQEAGRDVFRRLAASADVVVEAFWPGHMASLGLGYEDLRAANPHLIMTSITGFGQTGPHAGWQSNDLVALAASGVLTLSGYVDRPPYRPYPEQAVYCAGIEGANATLLALYEREFSGEGQWIDVSAQESLSMAQETAMQLWDFQKRARPRTGKEVEPGLGSLHECADGYVYGAFGLLIGRSASISDLIRWMDEEGKAEDLVSDGVLASIEAAIAEARSAGRLGLAADPALLARIAPVLKRFLKTKTKEEVYVHGQHLGFFVAAVNDPSDLAESEQIRQQEWFFSLDHPELGMEVKFPGPPYRFAASPAGPFSAAPRLGQHTTAVLAEAGLSATEVAGLKSAGVI
ncbi:MAG TPA: CoA transferase [Dehalococcoidia bacterium]